MPVRPCLGCQRLTSATYCGRCQAGRNVYSDGSRRISRAERERRARAVAEWVGVHGWACPGYGVPPHASTDLTADHLLSVHATGDEGGALGVLCRGCNSRKNKR